ncbi:MAG: hypothetical protein KGK03_11150 [Candidatus Omnitrophica bacterium]|nr:hypothetical protein [Candidatus Omnitrophota bacterium]
MTKQWKRSACFALMLGGSSIFFSGCADSVVYQPNLNLDQRPPVSMGLAMGRLKAGLLMMTYNNVDQDIVVTPDGFSLISSGQRYAVRYRDFVNLNILQNQDYGYYYLPVYSNFWLKWSALAQAQAFDRALAAMIYYAKNVPIDTPEAFALFQRKAAEWRAMPQKPPLPEEVHRLIVLKDDAIQNNDFSKAADYYEQALAIDPMWPAGQYNSALIYAELKIYPLAVMHMKRYLALEPDAKDARADQDKIYLWEEKAKEDGISSKNPTSQPAQSSSSLFGVVSGGGNK